MTRIGAAEAERGTNDDGLDYVDTNHYGGHPDHLEVFATPDAADKEHDPEGVAFGYEVIGVDVERTGSGERSLPCC